MRAVPRTRRFCSGLIHLIRVTAKIGWFLKAKTFLHPSKAKLAGLLGWVIPEIQTGGRTLWRLHREGGIKGLWSRLVPILRSFAEWRPEACPCQSPFLAKTRLLPNEPKSQPGSDAFPFLAESDQMLPLSQPGQQLNWNIRQVLRRPSQQKFLLIHFLEPGWQSLSANH